MKRPRHDESRVPVDSQWAWVCCFGSFISMYYAVGAFKSMGVLFAALIHHFDSSSSVTALVMGLSCAGLALFSPVAGYLSDIYGHRAVVMSGAVFSALGPLLTAFAPNIYFAVIVFGFLNGIGNAFMLTPSLIIVTKYFKRWRTLANGIAMAGGSLGQLTIPWLLEYWLKEYNLKGTLILYSGHFLHAMIGGALLRPISFYNKRTLSTDSDIDICDGEDELLHKEKISNDKPMEICHTNDSLMEKQEVQIYENTPRLPMLPFVLFRNPMFAVYVFGICLGNCGYMDSILYLPVLSKERDQFHNISSENAAINSSALMSLLGICDLIGRLLGGVIADMKFLRRSILAAICLFIISGAAMFTAMSFQVKGDLYILALALGFGGGLYSSVFTIILMDYIGIDIFPRALSFAFMFMGLTNTALPPLLGSLKDIYGNYNGVYLITSVMMFFAALSFVLEKIIRQFKYMICCH